MYNVHIKLLGKKKYSCSVGVVTGTVTGKATEEDDEHM